MTTSTFLVFAVIAAMSVKYTINQINSSQAITKENIALIDFHFSTIEKGLQRMYFSTLTTGSIPMSSLAGTYLASEPKFIHGEAYTASISIIDNKPYANIELILNDEMPSYLASQITSLGGYTIGTQGVGIRKPLLRQTSKNKNRIKHASMFTPHDHNVSERAILGIDGLYYVYEQDTENIQLYTSQEFTDKFTFNEIDVSTFTTQTLSEYESIVFLGQGTCGVGADKYTCSAICPDPSVNGPITHAPYDVTYSTGTSAGQVICEVFPRARWWNSIAKVTVTPRTSSGFNLSVSADAEARVSLSVPLAFRPFFGNTLTSTGSKSKAAGTGTSTDGDIIGWTVRPQASAIVKYFFDEDWQGSGLKFAYTQVYSNSGSTSRFLSVDETVNTFYAGATMYIAHTGDKQYIYRALSGGKSELVKLNDDGTIGDVIIQGLTVAFARPDTIFEIVTIKD